MKRSLRFVYNFPTFFGALGCTWGLLGELAFFAFRLGGTSTPYHEVISLFFYSQIIGGMLLYAYGYWLEKKRPKDSKKSRIAKAGDGHLFS